MSIRTAVYPGFFDPFTNGHLNIVERASKIFDTVVVAIAGDSPKHGLFTVQERLDLTKEVLTGVPNVRVETFSGLLVDYAAQKDAAAIIRGIRTVSDFEYEFQMSLANKVMHPQVETLFIMTDSRYSYLSSTIIKEVARLAGDVSKMVPAAVARRLKEKYAG